MDKHFWIKAWNEGRTQFHQADYNHKLLQYFPSLGPKSGQSVLVPLCGKTKDMIWLQEQGLHVHGVELHEQAVKDFFSENKLGAPELTHEPPLTRHKSQNITIRCGDLFAINEIEAYDFVYDRGALVALPSQMRKDYARVITQSLKKGGQYLLITYEYDMTQMEGPPFSLQENEIQELYADHFLIELMEIGRQKGEGGRLVAVESLRQKVHILKKK